MSRPVHFELSAKDPERAVKFYSNVFGWKVEKWAGPAEYWLIQSGEEGEPGIDGAIMASGEHAPATVNTISVTNVDEAVAKIVEQGGQVIMPKGAVPGIGWMAYCLDTEGVQFGLMQMDPEAK
jgi:uncharacterized protein